MAGATESGVLVVRSRLVDTNVTYLLVVAALAIALMAMAAMGGTIAALGGTIATLVAVAILMSVAILVSIAILVSVAAATVAVVAISVAVTAMAVGAIAASDIVGAVANVNLVSVLIYIDGLGCLNLGSVPSLLLPVITDSLRVSLSVAAVGAAIVVIQLLVVAVDGAGLTVSLTIPGFVEGLLAVSFVVVVSLNEVLLVVVAVVRADTLVSSVTGFIVDTVKLTNSTSSGVGIVAVCLSTVLDILIAAMVSVQVVLVELMIADGASEVVGVTILAIMSMVAEGETSVMVASAWVVLEVRLGVGVDTMVGWCVILLAVISLMNLLRDVRNIETIEVVATIIVFLFISFLFLVTLGFLGGNSDGDLAVCADLGGGCLIVALLVFTLVRVVVLSPPVIIGMNGSLVLLVIVRVGLD